MNVSEAQRGDILALLARLAIATAASYITVKLLVSVMDPTSSRKKDAKKKVQEIFKKMGIKENFNLSEHELMIASQLVMPDQLNTTWNDVAGLSSVIEEIWETLILPINQRNRKKVSHLIQPPKGILLYGPPGCGKTLLARAVATEAGVRFINLDVSSLTDKWYGESQKLSSAVFSFAAKIQPCIIFIDEIDSFLRVRSTNDHEATAMMKAQFLQQWDGLATDHSHLVLVMGTTNRPQDVDKAILRRMPSSFHIPFPNAKQREEILKLILKEENVSKEVSLSALAMKTEGFSGSDLKELCRNAAVHRLKQFLPAKQQLESSCESEEEDLQPIEDNDFSHAFAKVRESRMVARPVNPYMKLDSD